MNTDAITKVDNRTANRDAIFALMPEIGYVVANWKLKDFWATRRTLGQITGVAGNLTVVATDGNVGIFLSAGGAMLGHTKYFTGVVEPLFKAESNGANRLHKKRKAPKVLTEKQKRAKALDDL